MLNAVKELCKRGVQKSFATLDEKVAALCSHENTSKHLGVPPQHLQIKIPSSRP
jgi:hypothetical protein